MADIFISYSKTDRDLAVRLAAMLEAEGWSVWWDKGLKPADTYRDEIMKQLAAARAVICVWTENSIKSDWVRAEAGRAKADGKLIPVKTAGVDYKDIPLPFGEMHTENIDRNDLIQAAVVAQLAKPTHQQPVAIRVGKQLKYQFISWLGIAGGALSLFAQLDQVIRLSDWSRLIVNNWRAWNHWLWTEAMTASGIATLLLAWRITLDVSLTSALSFCIFILLIATGVRLRAQASDKPETFRSYANKVWRSITAVPKPMWIGIVALSIAVPVPLVHLLGQSDIGDKAIAAITILSLAALIFIPYITARKYRAAFNEGLKDPAAHTNWLVLIVAFVFLAPKSYPTDSFLESDQLLYSSMLATAIGVIACFIAPPRPLAKRLLYVVAGLGILMALNELSKLNLTELLPHAMQRR